MAYTTIDKATDYFNTVLYSGTDSSNPITGVGFQPDLTWVKSRSVSSTHKWMDVVRGNGNTLASNNSNNESSDSSIFPSLDSDGFTVAGTANSTNASGQTYVGWNWLGSNTTASNLSGSITSTVSANTTAGFSIVSWTGSGADATVGHGLSSAPQLVIVKNRTDTLTNWRVGQTITSSNNMTAGNGYYLELDDTKASTNPGSAVTWGATPTAPTSSVFTVGSNNSNNGSGDNMIAYCFHSVKGYSKMGSYTGNGDADGTFIYTGFKPAWIMVKNTSSARSWLIHDNKRDTFNAADDWLAANLSNVETNSSSEAKDFLSNGWKIRGTGTAQNISGETYIYMAFAENPFVTGALKLPSTAR